MPLKSFSRRLVISIVTYFICQFGHLANAASNAEKVKRLPPIISYILADDVEVIEPFSSGSFLENDGLIVVDLESLTVPSGWQLKSGGGAIGGYLEWLGSNNFNSPGNGLISLRVAVSTPGTYRFLWRSSFREGTNPTEANDSWLRVFADNFYGYRSGSNTTVCPKEQLASNSCVSNRQLNGSSRDGWFKVFRSGGQVFNWDWISNTSDNDSHQVYAYFGKVGEYQIQISGRSKHHAIDRFVLFRSLNASENVTQNYATNSARPQSLTVP